MAISKTIILSNGLVAENAYIRVDTVNGSKNGIDISVNSYLTESAFVDGQGYLEQKMYNFVPSIEDDSFNFIKQGYEYIKSLSEYSEATNI